MCSSTRSSQRWPTRSLPRPDRLDRAGPHLADPSPGLVGAAGGDKGHGVPALSRAVGVADAGRAAARPVLADNDGAGIRVGGLRQHSADGARASQGGYDWGMLAYAVGYGGSMIWFGSSAGVAITNIFPEARSSGRGSAMDGTWRSPTSWGSSCCWRRSAGSHTRRVSASWPRRLRRTSGAEGARVRALDDHQPGAGRAAADGQIQRPPARRPGTGLPAGHYFAPSTGPHGGGERGVAGPRSASKRLAAREARRTGDDRARSPGR